MKGVLLINPPLVLDVRAELPAKQVAAVGDVERGIDRRPGGRVERSDRIYVLDPGLLALGVDTGAKGVRIVEAVRAVTRNAVEERASEDVGRDAIEEQIADRIGHEVEIAVARIIRELHIDILDGSLPGDHPVGVPLVLPLIDVGGIESGVAGQIETGFAERRVQGGRLPDIVGNLVTGFSHTGGGDEPGRRVVERRCVAEEPALLRVIVKGVEGRGRTLKAEACAEVTAGGKQFGIGANPAIFKVWRYGLPAAAINADGAARQRRPAFGGDVDDAGGMQAVLRRHRPGDQPHAANEGALQNLRETLNTDGQQNSVDAILNIAVLVADMKIARAR